MKATLRTLILCFICLSLKAEPPAIIRDKSGKIIGSVGDDGIVRKADGSVVATTQDTGKTIIVRDKNGKIIATITK